MWSTAEKNSPSFLLQCVLLHKMCHSAVSIRTEITLWNVSKMAGSRPEFLLTWNVNCYYILLTANHCSCFRNNLEQNKRTCISVPHSVCEVWKSGEAIVPLIQATSPSEQNELLISWLFLSGECFLSKAPFVFAQSRTPLGLSPPFSALPTKEEWISTS